MTTSNSESPSVQELHRVRVDDAHLRVRQRVVVELRQLLVPRGQPRDGRIQVHQRDGLHLRVAQHLARREPVPAAQDQHPLHRAGAHHGRVHQRLVVAVLVDAGELQVAVEEQREAPLAPREDDPLVRRAGGAAPPRPRRAAPRRTSSAARPAPAPPRRNSDSATAFTRSRTGCASTRRQQPRAPQPHQRVEQAEEQRGAHQPQLRHEATAGSTRSPPARPGSRTSAPG